MQNLISLQQDDQCEPEYKMINDQIRSRSQNVEYKKFSNEPNSI